MQNNEGIYRWLWATCLVTTLSQIPAIYNNAVLDKIYIVFWIILLVRLLFEGHSSFVFPSVLLVPIIFNIYVWIASMISEFTYLNANLIRPVNLCTFMLYMGFLIGMLYEEDRFSKVIKVFIIGVQIVTAIIYFEYVRGRTITAGGYLYTAKNSLASLILIAVILMVIWKDRISLFSNSIVFFTFLIFDVVMMVVLKCRVNLFVAAFLLVIYILTSRLSISKKVLIIGLLVAVVIYIFENPEAYDLIVNKIMLKGYGMNELDKVTSNRLTHLERFKVLFPEHPIIGRGFCYIESFPLAALGSFGIIGGAILFIYASFPILQGRKLLRLGVEDKLGYSIVAVSVSLMLNGIGEELPPFGPGVKCFMMWLLAGIGYSIINYRMNQESSYLNDVYREHR